MWHDDMFNGLPRWARVALAARAVRRAQPMHQLLSGRVPPRYLSSLVSAVNMSERHSAGIHDDITQTHAEMRHNVIPIYERAASFGRTVPWELDDYLDDAFLDYLGAAANLVEAVDAAHQSDDNVLNDRAATAIVHADVCFSKIMAGGGKDRWRRDEEYLDQVRFEVQRDTTLLRDASNIQQWSKDSVVPLDFFPLRSEFLAELKQHEHHIVQVVAAIDRRLLWHTSANPEFLLYLTPRQFEEFVAELLQELGFAVELTARTRDGGFDIAAISNSVIGVRHLIECKRFAPTRAVGVSVVRELHGTVLHEGASKGVIVTTGRFSRDAQHLLNQHPWTLEGKDFNGLCEWLRQLQKTTDEKLWKEHNRVC